MQTPFPALQSPTQIFTKETLVRGEPAQLKCVEIAGQHYSISRGPTNVISLEDEWFEDVDDPESVIQTLKKSRLQADIFSFWQRLPDLEPRYNFYKEWESLAVLPIKTFDHWFTKQISSRLRGQIRKAKKDGLEVRETEFDDEFVRGMTDIFNETPVRQGRRFWHYGKDFETVKRQFSRYIHRETMIGAYYQGKLIGVMMLCNAGNYGLPGQIISKVEHRDKVTNNVLIGKAIEVCEKKKLPWLVYYYWTNDSLAEFKRRCGFEETKAPRYFVPLTPKGKLALKFGFHHGWKGALPDQIKNPLKKLRRFWYDFKSE
jgi:hypothetical protein